MIKDLDDIAWFQEGPGVRNYQYTTNGTKLINVSNLGGINLNLSNTSRYISNEEANGKYRHFLCDAGDLVIASSGINETSISEKVSIIKKDDLPLCMNTSVIRFKPLNNDELSVKYLYYFFKSDSYKKQIMKLMTGIAQLNYGPSHLHRIKINYVEKAQQERITSQLDSLSSLVETQKKQLTLLDELIKSRFIEMFGDPVKNEKGWDSKMLAEITTKIGSGATPNGGRSSYSSSGISFIRSMNVYDGSFLYDDLAYLNDEQAEKLKGVTILKNDILLNITGASAARTCIVPDDVLPARVNQHVSIIRLKNNINPIFMNRQLFCGFMKDKLLGIGESSGTTRQAITKSDLENLYVILPPIELQNEFASFVKQVDKSKFVVHSRYFLCDILTLFSSTIA